MWYSPTGIISLALLVLRPKMVLQLIDFLSELSLFLSYCLCFLERHGVFYTSAIPEITWYEPLYNNLIKENGFKQKKKTEAKTITDADYMDDFNSSISSTESDVNIRLAKAWTAIDWLSIYPLK